MSTLVFYSDQIIPANSRVDARLVELMKPRGSRIGYVPSGPEPDRRFYEERKAYYARIGLELAVFCDSGDPTDADSAALLACDAIHLSGGNTRAFLTRLRQSGMLDRLRGWAMDGGMLIGTSAGAILMTPTIAVDALFGDERPESVRDGSALGLVDFEFFPHLQARHGYLSDLLAYSKITPRPIFACPDGDGIVVTDGAMECIREPVRLFNGTIGKPDAMPLDTTSA